MYLLYSEVFLLLAFSGLIPLIIPQLFHQPCLNSQAVYHFLIIIIFQCNSSHLIVLALSLSLLIQGHKGHGGMPGIPGMKGHRVSAQPQIFCHKKLGDDINTANSTSGFFNLMVSKFFRLKQSLQNSGGHLSELRYNSSGWYYVGENYNSRWNTHVTVRNFSEGIAEANAMNFS